MKYPVFMDCDIGTDDAVAMMLAHASPEIELLGISSVCGNVCQEDAFLNTHRINGLMGTHYPVYRGAEKPLMQNLYVSSAFHGSNGLGDVALPLPEPLVVEKESAWEALYREASAHPGELRLIATGPLTNVATAFIQYPYLPGLLHTVFLMGGSVNEGNVSPAAEFNIYTDPQAADIVFRSGVRIVMCGLDVTMQTCMDEQELQKFAAAGTPVGNFVHDCLQCGCISRQKYGLPGVPMHGACPVMVLTHPEFFEGKEAGVAVETRSRICNGMTVTDLYSDKKFSFKNAFVVLQVDRNRFMSVLQERVLSICAGKP